MANVTLEHVSKRFGDGTYGVRDLDLEVKHGELVCLVGPSGCGKSTALELIAGLQAPTSGAVRIADVDVTGKSPGERDVAMVFQSYALYPHLDVAANIGFPLKVSRISAVEIDRRVREVASQLGLDALLKRRPRELSGGQRQRVALARALVRRPQVYLFDEPLSNLDANLRVRTRGEIKKLHEQLGGTFIYVTHDQAEAMTLADRVVLMKDGAAQQTGRPRDLYDQPQNQFVAEFFGAPRINLATPESLGISQRGPPGEWQVGLRPEHVEMGEGTPASGALPGRVYLVEPMGSESWVTVELGSGARVTARASGDTGLKPGSAAWIRFEHAHLHWFDARTGVRRTGSFNS